MTLALLHLNDQALRLCTETGEQRSESGYVQIDDNGLISGDAARADAWLRPQFSYNQHWRQLDQRPLKKNLRWARSHADMAYAQLRQLLHGIDQPQLVLGVPASLDDSQLALLLGLLKAQSVRVCGIVDNALLSAAPEHRAVLELQQHQSVISHLKRADGHLQVASHELLLDLGALAIQRDVARHVSDQLIADTRYDPLHSSASQQALHDALPDWLARLAQQTEYLTELPSPQGLLALRLNRARLQEILAPRSENLNRALQHHAANHLAVAPASELLATFSLDLNPDVTITDAANAARRGLALGRAWQRDPPTLQRQQSLAIALIDDRARRPSARRADSTAQPQTDNDAATTTHLLYKNFAWRLDQPLSISLAGDQLDVAYGQLASADITLIKDAQG
ncbi:MAG: hypothetical protein ACJ04O_12060, partial [Cellvibrionales bacterium]